MVAVIFCSYEQTLAKAYYATVNWISEISILEQLSHLLISLTELFILWKLECPENQYSLPQFF